MKNQRKLGLLPRYSLTVGLSLLGIVLLAGCGGGEDETASQQGQALVPDSGAPAEGDSTALAAYDLDKEIAAVEEQLGVDLRSLQGVMSESETAEQNEVLPEATPEAAVTAPAPAAPTIQVETAPVLATPAPEVAGDFGLQLGSFRTEERAGKLIDQLRELGHQPVIERAEVSGQLWQRVCLWGMSDKAAATLLGERLHTKLGTDYLVRQRP